MLQNYATGYCSGGPKVYCISKTASLLALVKLTPFTVVLSLLVLWHNVGH